MCINLLSHTLTKKILKKRHGISLKQISTMDIKLFDIVNPNLSRDE